MKVVITSSGDTPDSLVDRRFGRCNYFAFCDTITGECNFVTNPNNEKMEGAGVSAVNLVAEKGVEKVVSGEFGAKVKSLFDQLQIQLISVPDQSSTIRQILDMLKQQ
jgi:predicted Fe-Mo cluster-binding NifX family protein